MLKVWHKEDVFNALQARGWMGPALLEYPKDWDYVGEAWSFSRANWILNLYFVADYGTGCSDPLLGAGLCKVCRRP
jgi:hypothetical protein